MQDNVNSILPVCYHKFLTTKCQLTTALTYTAWSNLLYTNKCKNHVVDANQLEAHCLNIYIYHNLIY